MQPPTRIHTCTYYYMTYMYMYTYGHNHVYTEYNITGITFSPYTRRHKVCILKGIVNKMASEIRLHIRCRLTVFAKRQNSYRAIEIDIQYIPCGMAH